MVPMPVSFLALLLLGPANPAEAAAAKPLDAHPSQTRPIPQGHWVHGPTLSDPCGNWSECGDDDDLDEGTYSRRRRAANERLVHGNGASVPSCRPRGIGCPQTVPLIGPPLIYQFCTLLI
jgi:hypothetical protein